MQVFVLTKEGDMQGVYTTLELAKEACQYPVKNWHQIDLSIWLNGDRACEIRALPLV